MWCVCVSILGIVFVSKVCTTSFGISPWHVARCFVLGFLNFTVYVYTIVNYCYGMFLVVFSGRTEKQALEANKEMAKARSNTLTFQRYVCNLFALDSRISLSSKPQCFEE